VAATAAAAPFFLAAVAVAAATVEAAAAFSPGFAEAGLLVALECSLLPRPRRSSFVSPVLACAGRQGASCPGLACMAEWELDGWQEKLKHFCPPRISKTILPQQLAAMHARYQSSMQEVAGSREGVAVVAKADLGRFSHCCWPLSIPHMEEGGWWQAGQLAGWLEAPSSQPFTQEGEWR
jgi:hypothetical protein